jgi:hypothetical protein
MAPACNRTLGLRWLAALAAATVQSERAPAQAAAVGDSSRVVVLSHTSRIFANTRSIRVYLPRGYDVAGAARRYPTFYFNDGFAVFSPRLWNAPRILDSLIAARAIPPIIVIGIDNAASIPGVANPGSARASEFMPWPDPSDPDVPAPRGDDYAAFVAGEIMPLIAGTFRVLDGPSATGIGGASLGGIAALTTVLRHPGKFGMLLLESTPLFLFNRRLLDETRTAADLPGSVYVGVGTRETDDSAVIRVAHGVQEAFVGIVRERAPRARVRLNVVEGATHSAAAWRTRLPGALAFLFAPLQ